MRIVPKFLTCKYHSYDFRGRKKYLPKERGEALKGSRSIREKRKLRESVFDFIIISSSIDMLHNFFLGKCMVFFFTIGSEKILSKKKDK